MKNTKLVNINGHSIILSERLAYDSRDAEDYAVLNRQKLSSKAQMALVCVKISDSIRTAAKSFKFYNMIKKYTSRKVSKVSWLMKHLSDTEIFELDDIIDELEDYEKKKTLRQTESRSAA